MMGFTADGGRKLGVSPTILLVPPSLEEAGLNIVNTVDDQTVAKTDATATRSRAGIVEAVEATGVCVRCDEALARAA